MRSRESARTHTCACPSSPPSTSPGWMLASRCTCAVGSRPPLTPHDHNFVVATTTFLRSLRHTGKSRGGDLLEDERRRVHEQGEGSQEELSDGEDELRRALQDEEVAQAAAGARARVCMRPCNRPRAHATMRSRDRASDRAPERSSVARGTRVDLTARRLMSLHCSSPYLSVFPTTATLLTRHRRAPPEPPSPQRDLKKQIKTMKVSSKKIKRGRR